MSADHSIDFSKVSQINASSFDDEAEAILINDMHVRAQEYILSFEWCQKIEDSYLGLAVGGVVAVFLFKIIPRQSDVDEWMWVIVGDLPPAYITTESAPNPACALDGYIGAMTAWVEAVRAGKSVDDLIPVNVPATLEWAEDLASRLKFIDENILAAYAEDLEQ